MEKVLVILTSGEICHRLKMLSARESGDLANFSDRQYSNWTGVPPCPYNGI